MLLLFSPSITIALCALCGTTVGGVKTFMDAVRNGRPIFQEYMQKEFAVDAQNLKTYHVKHGLLSSLFPERMSTTSRDDQQLMERIKEIFQDGRFDNALPDMILHRIDQFAHMKEPFVSLKCEIDPVWSYYDQLENQQDEQKDGSSASDSTHLITKIRLFFYRCLNKMVDHLDSRGIERAKLYRDAELKRYKHVHGHVFQLYLADWLQNGVLDPLGQQIFDDLIKQKQDNWQAIVPFCVHMSLRAFFINYDELLSLDHCFSLENLIDSSVSAFGVNIFVHLITQKLAKQGKTVKELVKPIRDQIFANLPLPDDSLTKLRLKQALLVAANGLGDDINKRGDQPVLLQFFTNFYRELVQLDSPKWLQTLMDQYLSTQTNSANSKADNIVGESSGHHHADNDEVMETVAEDGMQYNQEQQQEGQREGGNAVGYAEHQQDINNLL